MAMYRDGKRKLSFRQVYNEAMIHPLSYWEGSS